MPGKRKSSRLLTKSHGRSCGDGRTRDRLRERDRQRVPPCKWCKWIGLTTGKGRSSFRVGLFLHSTVLQYEVLRLLSYYTVLVSIASKRVTSGDVMISFCPQQQQQHGTSVIVVVIIGMHVRAGGDDKRTRGVLAL